MHRSTKRQKEQARAQHKRDKETKKEERKKMTRESPTGEVQGEDPDIAHIIPGPQPPMEF